MTFLLFCQHLQILQEHFERLKAGPQCCPRAPDLEDVSRRGLRPAQLALLSSTVLDVPLLRQLLRGELSQESLTAGEMISISISDYS